MLLTDSWCCHKITHTYDPQAVEGDFVMVPLQVVIPPLMGHMIREVWIRSQAWPHLRQKGGGVTDDSGTRKRYKNNIKNPYLLPVCV